MSRHGPSLPAAGTVEVLARTDELDRAQWLQLRRQGIGGSDAAAIAGLDPYRSPIAVYLDKVGDLTDDREDNEAMAWGRALEDVIAREYAARTGLKVRRKHAVLRSTRFPWMPANVDRIVSGHDAGPGLLEIKTTSARAADRWQDGEIPDRYVVQLSHYLAVTGYQWGALAVLIGGQKLHLEYVPRDDALIDHLTVIEGEFWDHVQSRTPPPVDSSKATAAVLDVLYPHEQPESRVLLPEEARGLIGDYDAAKAAEKEAKRRKDAAANALKALLGDAQFGYLDGDPVVEWRTVNRKAHEVAATSYRKLNVRSPA